MVRKGAGREMGGETGGENSDGTDGCRLVNENGKKKSWMPRLIADEG